MALDALRPFRGSAAGRSLAVERMAGGSFEVEWQFASAAGPHLHARSAAQSSLASAHHDRALGARVGAGTQRFRSGTTGTEAAHGLHAAARAGDTRRLRHERPGPSVVGHGTRTHAARTGVPSDD